MEYWLTILALTGFNILLALSMYVVMLTGQLSAGQAAFLAIGAYTSAIGTMLWGLSLPAATLLGAGLAGLAGFLVGFPCLRLRGIYLAIGTLGFGEMVRLFFMNFQYGRYISPPGSAAGATGAVQTERMWLGPNGSVGFPLITYLEDHHVSQNEFIASMYVIITAAILLLTVLERSRLGFTLRAIGEDEILAQSLGLNVTYFKTTAFALSGFIGGVAGGLQAHYMTYIEPQQFSFDLSVLAIVFVAIGGTETLWGPIAGAALLTFLPEWLRVLKDYRMVLYGAVLVVTMIYRPQGLVSLRPFGSRRIGRAHATR